MASGPRKLQASDTLYRAVFPEQYDPSDDSLFATAFEDTGKDPATGEVSDTLSFSVEGEARPTDALAAISGRGAVRRQCGTKKEKPSPELMYEKGFRVAKLSAAHVIAVCQKAGTDISIKLDGAGNEVEPNGHLQVLYGDRLADVWARNAEILDEDETLNG